MKRPADSVYVAIRDNILARRHRPGETISANDHASELDCKVGVVIAAYKQLAIEGFLRPGARAKGIIRGWSENELRDALEARQQILGFATLEAASQRNPLTVARLKSIVTVLENGEPDMRQKDDVADCFGLFEVELCNGTGVEGLAATLRNLFPPSLVRTSALVSDQVGIRRRCKNYHAAISMIQKREPSNTEELFSIDPIDTMMITYITSENVDGDATKSGDRLFRSREKTYERWVEDRIRLSAGQR